MSIKIKLTQEQKKILQEKYPQASLVPAASLQKAEPDEWMVNGLTQAQIDEAFKPVNPAIEAALGDESRVFSNLVGLLDARSEKRLGQKNLATMTDLAKLENESKISITAIQETFAKHIQSDAADAVQAKKDRSSMRDYLKSLILLLQKIMILFEEPKEIEEIKK